MSTGNRRPVFSIARVHRLSIFRRRRSLPGGRGRRRDRGNPCGRAAGATTIRARWFSR